MSFSTWLHRQSNHLILALSQERIIHGVRVVLTTDSIEEDAEAALERARGAIDLIALHDPRRLKRMRADIRLVWVRRHPLCRGSYDPVLRACIIDLPNFVANRAFTPVEIAASIVHEAMHARLINRGCAYDDQRGTRVERICRKAEISFAERLPEGGGPVVERARQILLAIDEGDGVALSTAEIGKMQRRQAQIQLEHLGASRWMKSLLRWKQ